MACHPKRPAGREGWRCLFENIEFAFGLREFEDVDIYAVLTISEEEPDRYYVKDLKSGKLRFVYDAKKNKSEPEEIVRILLRRRECPWISIWNNLVPQI